jgi:hypothetical protein
MKFQDFSFIGLRKILGLRKTSENVLYPNTFEFLHTSIILMSIYCSYRPKFSVAKLFAAHVALSLDIHTLFFLAFR